METKIHPTAIISKKAEIGTNVSIGPYSIIEDHVKIGANTKIHAHCVFNGHTTIDEGNEFYPFCSIGQAPQDLSYKDEPTELLIGKNNIFRENVSIHRGTTKQDMKTIIGNNCLLMAYVHVGHDGILGDNCIVANSVNFAGHVHVGDKVTIGGGTQISQFVTLGRGSYIGGATAINRDIPIFCTAYGNRAQLRGINIIGLRRGGVSKADISEFVDFYRTIEASALSPASFIKNSELMKDFEENDLILEMVNFISNSDIGIAPFTS